MLALVFHGPGQKSLADRAKPALLAPGDAIVRVTRTTICGTDLHILKGAKAARVVGIAADATAAHAAKST